MRNCELCKSAANAYCESDHAVLCWNCDAKVHGANFLVARHSRSLLCHACQSPTPWKASGSKLGHTVSVCESCVTGTKRKGEEEEEEEEEEIGGANDDDDEDGDEEEVDEDVEAEDREDEEDGENQVVPWSSTPPPPPPPTDVSSSISKGTLARFSWKTNPCE